MSDIKATTAKRFEILQQLQKCRFSVYLRVMDSNKGEKRVIKAPLKDMPLKTQESISDAKSLLKVEGNLLRGLKHPCLLRPLEVNCEGVDPLLIFDDLYANSLFSMVMAHKFKRDGDSVRQLMRQLLDAAGYLHRQNPRIINGGIHPQSVLILEDGQPVIVEFGFVTIGVGPSKRTDFRVHGSRRYCSPEQLTGSDPNPSDDIYSIGAVAYFAATGQEPDSSLDRRGKKVTGNVRASNPDISPELEKIILGMISTDPDKKYQSVEEVIEDLDQGRCRFEITPSQVTQPAPREQEPPEEPESQNKPVDFLHQEIDLKSIVGGLHLPDKGKEVVRAAPEITTAGSTFLLRYPFVDLARVRLNRNLSRLIPKRISKSIRGVVMEMNEFDEVTVAVEDPSQILIYDHISYISKGKLRPLIYRADPRLISLAQEFIYDTPDDVEEVGWYEFLEKKRYSDTDLEIRRDKSQMEMFDKDAVEGPVIEAANRIVKEAISLDASDIHLETFEEKTILRYRIDGVLHVMDNFPREKAKKIIKRFKILAGMDIGKERVSQGGRIEVEIAKKAYDLRASVIPVIFGESLVMRILDKGSFNYTLEDLGFDEGSLKGYKDLLSRPHGMILVSGPTGSGKSTTLYASLKEINRADRKLLTIEDPVEYQMQGINQVQVNLAPLEDDNKMTFSRALREFLRQDPDVILVGEIRDSETAQISVQAALTGHLLLSTIHTNDSVGIVTRLRDMGVAPYLVGSVLIGGIAQRLVRRICKTCKSIVEPTPAEKKIFAEQGVPLENLYQGKGCDACHNYGYRGRTGIYELFRVDQDTGDLISSGANASEIRRLAREKGMKEMIGDALEKAARGLISMEEVSRVLAG